MAFQSVELTTLSRTSPVNLATSAEFLGQESRTRSFNTFEHHYSVIQVEFVTNRYLV